MTEYDDFIRSGFLGSDGVLHARTRLGTVIHVAMPSAPALALRVGPISVVPPLRASIRIAGGKQ